MVAHRLLDLPNRLARSLEVPGLAENRPSVLQGDTVKVQIVGSEYKTTYEGVVWHLRESELGLCFNQSFHPES